MVLVDCDPVVEDHLADPIFAKSAITLVRDLAEPDAPRDVIRAALEKMESLNGLINCAAWSLHKALAETTIQEFDRLIAINQRAPFFLSQEFARAICGASPDHTPDPCIVNIASVNASVGNAYLTGYASTKGALVAMGRAMAVELAPRIRVVTVSPGAVFTTNTENLIAAGQIDVPILLERFLVKRFITVEEIADLVAFLFGPSAISITGCNWVIDGGLTAQ
jgi:glucose 1-dehydrogenase